MSSNFNIYERSIAKFLSKFPKLKLIIKSFYSRIVFIFSKKKYIYSSLNPVVTFGEDTENNFFGYYDKSPINKNGFVIVHSTTFDTKVNPDKYMSINIDVYHIDSPKKKVCSVITKAFNWQQGSRAHWISDTEFIFNTLQDNSYVSKVFSIIDNEVVSGFDYPVQDSYKNEYYLSLNYSRLRLMRPDYGYHTSRSEFLIDDSKDGIWLIDFKSNNSSLIISILDVCNFNSSQEFQYADHKINHVMISPDGLHFIFLHRYFVNGVKKDRLILSDCNGNLIKVLANYGMVSHCFWSNINTIISFMRGPDGVDTYYEIDIDNGNLSFLNSDLLSHLGDGHPHINNNILITDTYPNKSRMQELIKYDITSEDLVILGEFFHGFEFNGQSRCDLHPRISNCGNYVFFDSVFTGVRKFCMMKLDVE